MINIFVNNLPWAITFILGLALIELFLSLYTNQKLYTVRNEQKEKLLKLEEQTIKKTCTMTVLVLWAFYIVKEPIYRSIILGFICAIFLSLLLINLQSLRSISIKGYDYIKNHKPNKEEKETIVFLENKLNLLILILCILQPSVFLTCFLIGRILFSAGLKKELFKKNVKPCVSTQEESDKFKT